MADDKILNIPWTTKGKDFIRPRSLKHPHPILALKIEMYVQREPLRLERFRPSQRQYCTHTIAVHVIYGV